MPFNIIVMHTRLMSWSRTLYLAGIVLALIVVIPATWFPLQLGKLSFFALALLPAIILLTASGGVREFLRAHGIRAALLVALLPVVYVLSSIYSTNKLVGWTGFGIETDTVLFVVLAFLAFLLSFALFRTLRTVRMLLTAVFWALVAACIFQFLMITFGSNLIPFEAFADRSANLIGKWNDLGILVGLLAILVLSSLEFGYSTPLRKIISIGGLLVLTVLLGFINFALVWGLVLASALILAVVKFVAYRSERGAEQAGIPLAGPSAGKIPWYALSGAALALLFLFFGTSVNTSLTSLFPVTSLEVRPSYSSTLNVINASREGSAARMFIGTGPNTFGDAWLMQRPAEVNQSPFWNLDFNVGFSTLVTAFGSVGFLGLLAWLIPLGLVLAAVARAMRLRVLSREEKIAATTLVVGSLFLMVVLALYVPSQNIILLGFTLCGAAFGFLWRQGHSSEAGERDPSRLHNLFIGAAALSLMLLVLWSSFTTVRRFIAQSYTQAGSSALSEARYDDAITRAARARGVETTADALRLSVDAGNLKLQQLAATETQPQEAAQLQQQFAQIAQETIDFGRQALALDDRDYRAHLALGRVYEFLSTLTVEGAYESARQSYEAAAERNPTNPSIPLSLARLEASKNNLQLAQDHVTKALTLKPNYTDAILFVVQLNVAKNDISNAIQAALAAAQTAPGVAPIWFQLGLLFYANGNSVDAITALEQAVTLVSNYANAKYFLGLSYYAQNRQQDAVTLFEDLVRTNPDNAEVNLILGNLRQNKPPFEGATPPVTTPPEDREEAPISE